MIKEPLIYVKACCGETSHALTYGNVLSLMHLHKSREEPMIVLISREARIIGRLPFLQNKWDSNATVAAVKLIKTDQLLRLVGKRKFKTLFTKKVSITYT